jgi:hypothetical protein
MDKKNKIQLGGFGLVGGEEERTMYKIFAEENMRDVWCFPNSFPVKSCERIGPFVMSNDF